MIAILLCTYNGEKYLSQQIDSLIKQSFQDFTIYVHDDGSNDKTCSIIQEYEKSYAGKIIFLKDNIKGRGAKGSFMWLLNEVHADYYMFCDQDDIWLENKIEDSYKRILEVEKEHPDKPIVIHTDLTLVDQNLNVIHPSFWNYGNMHVDVSKKFEYLCLGNVVTGCTMIFNNKTKELSLSHTNNNINLHDWWIALITAKYGIVENLKKQTILYRQHTNNVVGCGKPVKKHHLFPSINVLNLYEWKKWYVNNKPIFTSIQDSSPLIFIWYRIKFFFKIRLQ